MMMRRGRLLPLVAVVGALLLALSAFTPSPRDPAHGSPTGSSGDSPANSAAPHRSSNDPGAVKGYLERLQRGVAGTQQECAMVRLKAGDRTRLCQRVVHDPVQVAKAAKAARRSRADRHTADPQPPEKLCSQKLGQVNYDRFHACGESLLLIDLDDPRGGPPAQAQILYWVWATLDADDPTWLMQVGLKPVKMDPKIIQVGPWETASLTCAENHCKIPDPQRKRIFLDAYTYYEFPTSIPDKAPGDTIKYSNPQIKLSLSADSAIPKLPDAYLVTPFNVRCDKESYIGGHGCVYYMGNSAAAIFTIDYKSTTYPEVVKHNLYAIEVRDNLKHYGHISYGNPLHRTDPITHDNNRNTICTTAIQQKAKSFGLTCDEYPYASSEE